MVVFSVEPLCSVSNVSLFFGFPFPAPLLPLGVRLRGPAGDPERLRCGGGASRGRAGAQVRPRWETEPGGAGGEPR